MTDLLDKARALDEQVRSIGDCYLLRTPTRTLGTLEVADTLRDLRAEVEHLTPQAECDRREKGCIYQMHSQAVDARDAALARVKELEAELDVMRPVVEAADSYLNRGGGLQVLGTSVRDYRALRKP